MSTPEEEKIEDEKDDTENEGTKSSLTNTSSPIPLRSESPPKSDQSNGSSKDLEESTKEAEEERVLNKELDESENEQQIKQEQQDASKLKIKPTPEAVKQEPAMPEPALRKTKNEEDIKLWKVNLMRLTQMQGATQINDEDYLINREGYKMNRVQEFATGHRSKLYKCKKEGVEQILKVTPLKNTNLRYKNNLLKNSITIMRYLIENPHPSLVLHLAFFQSPIKMYIFMEQLSNINLHSFVKKNRKPNSASYLIKVKKFGRDVAEGINHLYVLGISHCNIKTMNVCLTADQSNAKIVGFNNSMLMYNPIKSEEILCQKYTEWSYNYAPETSKGNFKCAPADVWAFGILIVCMLTGKPPFPKKMHRIETRLKAHLHRFFVSPEQTLLNLLMKCFEKDANKRIDIGSILLHPFFN